jgi:hypothetical protein
LLSARAIAEQPRVWQLGLGELDLCAEVGLQPSADERELLSIRLQVVLASAAAGLASPIGPVSTDFQDLMACGAPQMPFAVLGSAADGRSIPPRCQSSTRSSCPQQTRWRRRGILWSAMAVRSTRGSVCAWTRMAGWSMRRSCAWRVASWRGLATRWPRTLVSFEDVRPSRRRRKNFLYNHFKAGPAARQRHHGHRGTGLTLQSGSTITATPDGRHDSAGTQSRLAARLRGSP